MIKKTISIWVILLALVWMMSNFSSTALGQGNATPTPDVPFGAGIMQPTPDPSNPSSQPPYGQMGGMGEMMGGMGSMGGFSSSGGTAGCPMMSGGMAGMTGMSGMSGTAMYQVNDLMGFSIFRTNPWWVLGWLLVLLVILGLIAGLVIGILWLVERFKPGEPVSAKTT